MQGDKKRVVFYQRINIERFKVTGVKSYLKLGIKSPSHIRYTNYYYDSLNFESLFLQHNAEK